MYNLEISPTPVWIENAGVIPSLQAGEPVYAAAPGSNAVVLCSLADASAWDVDTNAYAAMQALDYNRPVKAGSFRMAPAAGRSPGEKALGLTPPDEPPP